MTLAGIEAEWAEWGFTWKRVGVFALKCSKCEREEEAHYHSKLGPTAKVNALRTNFNWVLKKHRPPICPDCRGGSKHRPVEQTTSTGETPEVTQMPAEMIGSSIKITLAIGRKLEEVLDKTNHVYKGDWSDEKVAKEINCSEKMVADIRVAEYGELAYDPHFKDEVEAALGLVSDQASTISGQISAISVEFGKVRKAQETLEERLNVLHGELSALKATTASINGRLMDISTEPTKLKQKFEAEFQKLLGSSHRKHG